MKPAGSASLSREADTALRKASVAAKTPRLRSQAIDNAEVAKVITSTLGKVRSTTRDRDRNAIRFASKTIALRYSNGSGLARPDVKSFTILTERANFRTLQHFHTWGVPDEVLRELHGMVLPEPFWVEYHASIRKSNPDLSRRYFKGSQPDN